LDSRNDERSLSDEDLTEFVLPSSDVLTVIGQDGCFKRVAPALLPAFGYVEAALLDRPFLSFIHPADRPATRAALEQLAQGQPTLGLENRFRGKSALLVVRDEGVGIPPQDFAARVRPFPSWHQRHRELRGHRAGPRKCA
jgi:PAS domain S-box-containing protein